MNKKLIIHKKEQKIIHDKFIELGYTVYTVGKSLIQIFW